MKLISFKDAGFTAEIERLRSASSLFDATVEQRTRDIIDEVRLRGDAALLELTERFDGARLEADQMRVSQAELLTASLKADDDLRQAIKIAHANIDAFSRKELRKDWQIKNKQGGIVGEKFDPFQRVGIYIPGGTAPLMSTALMTITLAKAAGCKEIVVCTPPGKNGQVNPGLLYAVRIAGATEILKIGGAQAIAAMALGTATVGWVQKIFGPGNAYVVAAKRLLFGHVAIDLLPGPSEVLVIADDSGPPKFIAADLLAQAEHGSGHERAWLLSPSGKLVRAVHAEITRQLPKRERREFIETALERNGNLIHVKDMKQAIAFANQFAPEHCEIMTKGAEKIAREITTAGAIFLGPYSPTVVGDYVAGPSHTLPTGGAGLSFAGLTAEQFQRRTSIVKYSPAALKKSLRTISKFAEIEGLEAHAFSATVRFNK